ncbi:MAG: secondary thiamine-phosphate synthase enzyme YjbQ [Acidobacteriota bacterium]
MATVRLSMTPRGRGLHDITAEVASVVREAGIDAGLCTVFLQHTSASLIIQENADPSARHDLESWFDRLIPDGDPAFLHTSEGPDDMPAHVKAALTGVSLSIPIVDGHLALGTWQGIFLWEHRVRSGRRNLVVHVG